MPNIREPESKKLLALYGAVQSILLYGAPIWKGAPNVAKSRAKIINLQRKTLLRVASGYCTISPNAIQAIMGAHLITLLVEEIAHLHQWDDSQHEETRREERGKPLGL